MSLFATLRMQHAPIQLWVNGGPGDAPRPGTVSLFSADSTLEKDWVGVGKPDFLFIEALKQTPRLFDFYSAKSRGKNGAICHNRGEGQIPVELGCELLSWPLLP